MYGLFEWGAILLWSYLIIELHFPHDTEHLFLYLLAT